MKRQFSREKRERWGEGEGEEKEEEVMKLMTTTRRKKINPLRTTAIGAAVMGGKGWVEMGVLVNCQGFEPAV